MSISFRTKNPNKPNKEKEDEEGKCKSKMMCLQEDDDGEDEDSLIKDSLSSKSDDRAKDSNNEDVESITDSIDEERLTLGQINKLAEKEKKKNESKGLKSLFINHKRKPDNRAIIYDENKGTILNTFCGSVEELNEFLLHCQIQKISYDDLSIPQLNNSSSISFDPNEWMKSNKIQQRTLSYEELSVYCYDKIKKKNNNKKNKEPAKIKEEDKKEKKIEKKEDFKKSEQDFKNPKLYNNYIELQKIISCESLSIEQKLWLNDLFTEINNTDINDIDIEKDDEGKDNKLEIVFDLDNTCIFSFLSSSDLLAVQSKKNILPQKEVKMFSFKYNNKVIYTVLIIRKGIKEFIQYVKRLCNFHISTLGAENYGNEIKDILSEYSGVPFIRYKGRLYEEEYSKNISDLYINKEKTVIFDDNIRVWENKKKDNEHVINTKFFFDEECAMININNENNNNNYSDKFCSEIDLFIKSYRTFSYNRIKPNNNDHNFLDWKKQQIIEYATVPFYQFKPFKGYNYNKCFTAEYLNSKKLQFIYMKNIIKQIYFLKYKYYIDIPLCIKLIRISTLANMIFDLKYLAYDQKNILTDMVITCGGIIFEKDYRDNDEKIYLVASKRLYEFKSRNEEIKKDLSRNPYYILINERFILDTYYFMTNLKDYINDPEYTFNKDE